MSNLMKFRVFALASAALTMLWPQSASAEPFPYASEAAVVQSCVQQSGSLEQCMCYLRELEKRISFKDLASFELAARTKQQVDKKLMDRVAEAQMQCMK